MRFITDTCVKIKPCLFSVVFIIFYSSFTDIRSQNPVISELMAVNNSVLADEDGDYSDWIEIYNPGTVAVNLKDWYLSDNPLNITKWKFPEVSLDTGEYMVVFASEKDRRLSGSNLHTNFKLSGSGEFLALTKPDGSTIVSHFGDAFPAQQADISYGLYSGQYIYMKLPTPGAENITGDYLIPPSISHKRGFYWTSFNVSVDNLNSNSDIYYTVDGSRPTVNNAFKYSFPILINKTTVFSAVAIDKTSHETSDVVTQTYLFIDDIIHQPNDPVGYPPVWGDGYTADYEMDPEICTDENKTALKEALMSIPTVSLVTNPGNIFSFSTNPDSGGIYIYTLETDEEWERPVSLEYFDPSKNLDFQVNCGLRLHGGNGRKPGNSPKHSFRVSFRSEYGPSKLNFNIFDEESAVNQFNSLVFRAGYNYSWVKNSPEQCEYTDYIRDPFAKNTQLDIGDHSAHNKFVHLYINGLYWGVYNISEKITDDFASDYMGGHEEDYDVVKDHLGLTDGTRAAWDTMVAMAYRGLEETVDYMKIQGRNEDGSINPAYQNLLDIKNFTDYIILNFYIGNIDWDGNNWLAARNRVTNDHGFKLFCWDAETSMVGLEDNVTKEKTSNSPTGIFHELLANNAYKSYFADRVHELFFNNGPLTPAETEARYMKIANTINKAMLGESARWGDYRRDVDLNSSYTLYTVDNHWLKQVDYMQNTYFPQRSEIVLNQLIEADLYWNTDAPDFNPFGGKFNAPVQVVMTSIGGDIYYTVDDSDPKDKDGNVDTEHAFMYTGPVVIDQNTIVSARVKDEHGWSALTKATYTIEITGVPQLTDNMTLRYGCYPNPVNKFTNIYFTIPADGKVKVCIYNLNGMEINVLQDGYLTKGMHSYTWYPENMTNGIYFYKIIYKQKCYTAKIVVNNF